MVRVAAWATWACRRGSWVRQNRSWSRHDDRCVALIVGVVTNFWTSLGVVTNFWTSLGVVTQCVTVLLDIHVVTLGSVSHLGEGTSGVLVAAFGSVAGG